MAVAKVECPECGAVLKPAKPLSPGNKIRCPKCANTFTVPGAGDGIKPAPARNKVAAGKAPAPKKPAPPAPKKPADDDDDGGGTYAVVSEPEDVHEEKDSGKPKIEYVPDLKVKDPRGPATEALAKPGNYIMVKGSLLAVSSILSLCIAIWPFIFTKWSSGVAPSDVKKEYERKNPPANASRNQNKDEEESSFPDQEKIMEEIRKNPKMEAIWDEMVEEDRFERILWACLSVVVLIFALIMAMAAVKMINLESYRWSMAASIMAICSGVAVPWGIICITKLRKPKVKEAFEYVPD